ncbi:DUF7322 domain-containing protein [Halocatena halophila]|uniref:DUF7322 domain-containing protein n=1 Tax=Halocatena halophila TaxID=2814576 RepID=UPI002ED17BF1
MSPGDEEQRDGSWFGGESHEFDPNSVEPPLDDAAGPQVDIPDAPQPSASSPAERSDVSVARTFWLVVVMVNIGLFGLTVGLLYAFVRGRVQFGGAIAVFGVTALFVAYRRYRAFRRS